MKLNVPDMTCGHCKAAIEKAIAALDAGADVRVDLDGRTVEMTTTATETAVIAALKAEGYPATPA